MDRKRKSPSRSRVQKGETYSDIEKTSEHLFFIFSIIF